MTPFCREVDKHLRRILPPMGYKPAMTDPEETWIEWRNPTTGHSFRMTCDQQTDFATLVDGEQTYAFAPGDPSFVARLNAAVTAIARRR